MKAHRSLPELKDLTIYEFHELEEIIAENGELVQLSNSEVCIPKLERIEVSFCHNLRSLFSVAMVRMPLQLCALDISNATQLEEVFSHASGDNSNNVSEIMETVECLSHSKLSNLHLQRQCNKV
ncbi:hypothetical protein MtrunA17_Chr3g0103241 [Medicago truncatula]|uniref:Disease resistance protein At4g27190-like leucine-rich repeats domain-containing protein n=1 Tax=Medicago truncatula TaxID=3880 RepID=A0A072UWW8_MEDTR|nr:hypothetical protein MTR_3g461460 [Medicago truncatula]RHN67487.1 hypothetical protein MtrunA17_Chr3g0103241 [Medicago truncatula]